ncbi:MAG: EAL domain-containing protein [Gammaproteobacteria bacterium]|nr:EAL domain-containing protein [Gammaproteobacteria bacterium]
MNNNQADSYAHWIHVLNAFEDPLYILDLDERIQCGNSAFYNLIKMPPHIAIGKKITTIMHPEGEDSPCPVCAARARHEDTYIVMEANHPNNARGTPFEVMIRTIKDFEGNPIGTLMGNRDLTRTRKVEGELQRLNEHISLLMDSTGEGIFGIDTQLRCTFVNRAAAEMLGYERDELLGKNMFDLVHHSYEDQRAYPKEQCLFFQTTIDGSSHWSDDDVLWDKDNNCFPVQYRSNPIMVKKAISGAVVVFRNVSATRAMVQQMEYLAHHDYLTGLYNRMEFEQRLSKLIRDTHRSGQTHVLSYIDLDQFKIVNDTCGHVAGDALLKQLSSVLHRSMRKTDTLARLGGDEFGVLYTDITLDDALVQLDRLFNIIKDFRFTTEEKVFSIGMSVGVVQIDNTSTSLAQVLSAADSACYLAKEGGRNRIHVYQVDDQAQVKRYREFQWVTRLKQALENKNIQLHCQRIIPAGSRDDNMSAVEVLMRIDDQQGQVVPGAFISVAERYDLMPLLDRTVIELMFSWLEKNKNRLRMDKIEFFTINISANSICQKSFLEFLVQHVRNCSIEAEKFCFELTETAAISNLSSALHFMTELKQLGCRFALDDFGSGMSSFGYLKSLPVDYVKIDGHFVRDITKDPVDKEMVNAINQIGHVMGLKTIAEFVETEEIAQTLTAMGIDYLQGYSIGHPKSLDECLLQES